MADTKVLKTLREETGLSYTLIQKALTESDGDVEKAKKLLSKWGAEFAEKKSDRVAKQGAIFSYIHHNKKVGTMVELLCETDFVAMNEDFQALGNGLAMQVASIPPESKEALLASPYVKDPSKTVDQLIKDLIFKIGENINLGRYERFEL